MYLKRKAERHIPYVDSFHSSRDWTRWNPGAKSLIQLARGVAGLDCLSPRSLLSEGH